MSDTETLECVTVRDLGHGTLIQKRLSLGGDGSTVGQVLYDQTCVRAGSMIAFVHAPTLIGIGIGVALSRMGAGLLPRWLRRTRQGFEAVDSDSVQWARRQPGQSTVTYFVKPLFEDQRTGDCVLLIRYPAGEINPSHCHPAAHGMYVLQGTLVTHRPPHVCLVSSQRSHVARCYRGSGRGRAVHRRSEGSLTTLRHQKPLGRVRPTSEPRRPAGRRKTTRTRRRQQ
jgi:hypothetical protein